MKFNLTRRGFFGFGAGAAVAGPSLANAAMEQARSFNTSTPRGFSEAAGMTGVIGGTQPSPPPDGLKALWRSRDELTRHIQVKHAFRVNGLEPDLAGLKLPYHTLARMQLDRDQEHLSFFEKIEQQIKDFKW